MINKLPKTAIYMKKQSHAHLVLNCFQSEIYKVIIWIVWSSLLRRCSPLAVNCGNECWNEHRTLAHFSTSLTSDQLRSNQNGCILHHGIFYFFFISTRQNFLQARIHTSHLHTGAGKCIPAARVAIWWQAVGGREDELCQWQPLKRTTHSPVAGEAWWMIISRCDRCGIGGGSLTFYPFLPLRLSSSRLAYLGQCFNTPLAWLYWHTPDSVW